MVDENINNICDRREMCFNINSVPEIVQTCINKLENENEKIFEDDPSDIQQAGRLLDRLKASKNVDDTYMTAKMAAMLLVLFFKEAYPPIFSIQQYEKIVRLRNSDVDGKKEIILSLKKDDPKHYSTLKALCDFLLKIKNNSVENQAADEELAERFAPSLVRQRNDHDQLTSAHQNAIVQFIKYCINNTDKFEEVIEN